VQSGAWVQAPGDAAGSWPDSFAPDAELRELFSQFGQYRVVDAQ
jgi:hypothetical protein